MYGRQATNFGPWRFLACSKRRTVLRVEEALPQGQLGVFPITETLTWQLGRRYRAVDLPPDNEEEPDIARLRAWLVMNAPFPGRASEHYQWRLMPGWKLWTLHPEDGDEEKGYPLWDASGLQLLADVRVR